VIEAQMNGIVTGNYSDLQLPQLNHVSVASWTLSIINNSQLFFSFFIGIDGDGEGGYDGQLVSHVFEPGTNRSWSLSPVTIWGIHANPSGGEAFSSIIITGNVNHTGSGTLNLQLLPSGVYISGGGSITMVFEGERIY
jgi:hypothetical protein